MDDNPDYLLRIRQRNRDTAENIVRRTQDQLAAAVGPEGRVILYRATPTVDDPFADLEGDLPWETP